MSKLPVTVLLAVRNEQVNIKRCLDSLAPAQEILVVDSASTDGTIEIARDAGCTILQFQYQGAYPKKRQWALDSYAFTTPWILLLDADEVVPTELWDEIQRVVTSDDSSNGYLICKSFHFLGKRLKFGGFSHSAVLLLKSGYARFEQLIQFPGDTLDMEVHERVIVEGPVGQLRSSLTHEDFKGLSAYIEKHNRYSSWEAFLRNSYLKTGDYGDNRIQPRLFGNAQERRRWLKQLAVRMPCEHWLWFFYHFFFRLGFLDGTRGLIAARVRANYIADVRSKMWEMKALNRPDNSDQN